MIENILVVCTGNICRSPIGEALFKINVGRLNREVSVESAGLHAMVGWGADEPVQKLMKERGIDLSHHRAKQITPALLFQSELILTMSEDQKKEIEQVYPSTQGRIYRLGKWGEYDVPDPFRRPELVYEQALALIEQGVNDWCERFWG